MKDDLVRVVPLILLKNGNVVQSYGFSSHPIIGKPSYTLRRMLDYQVDEVVILDITYSNRSISKKISRLDLAEQETPANGLEALMRQNSSWLCYPLALGGGIKTLAQAKKLVSLGADKVVLNAALNDNKTLVHECAESLGSQALVVSIDVIESESGFEVFDYRTSSVIQKSHGLLNQIEEAQNLGCGELLINNVSRDGTRRGFNLNLIELVSKYASIPVICAGGAGAISDFRDAILTGVSAVAASNFFHSNELSYPKLKQALVESVPVRPFVSVSKYISREKNYTNVTPRKFVSARIETAEILSRDYGKYFQKMGQAFTRCDSCLYPINSATSLAFTSGTCSGCSKSQEYNAQERSSALGEEKLEKILKEGLADRKSRAHDCVVAVSGGKDSYFQTHYVKNVLGLNPLLVTYDANNWTSTGRKNLERMSHVFSVDHEIVAPAPTLLSKMNLLGLIMMGDMSWHAHVGIFTVPMKVAVDRGIPFVFYGEHGREDIAGQFRYGDYPEITYRERTEHHARGFEWEDFVGLMDLTKEELGLWAYPSDCDLLRSAVRGLHLGSFIDWDPHRQTKLVKERYGFETSPVKFDRTYRVGSNLDDMHENGLHDWLKYVKFGYGRATDHGSKDIRLGVMDREEVLPLARQLDSVLPNDLDRWLQYTNISRDLFFLFANAFRSPDVWAHEDGVWYHPEGMSDNWTPQNVETLGQELEEIRFRLFGRRLESQLPNASKLT
ncbi:N-acetyl sugar amidotransferase [Litorivicinus sp.]|nr:N-acetyl sugar amidotransferase [Litorivicinus sp.]